MSYHYIKTLIPQKCKEIKLNKLFINEKRDAVSCLLETLNIIMKLNIK